MIDRARQWARRIGRDVIALWIAARDARTPWFAKAMAAVVAAYAVSPIDLIPDFIPVLGLLDDLLLLPAGILLVVRMIPAALMNEFRRKAALMQDRPISRIGSILVMAVWLLGGGLLLWIFWPAFPAGRG